MIIKNDEKIEKMFSQEKYKSLWKENEKIISHKNIMMA